MMKKHNYLIIGLTLIALSLLLAYTAYAETTVYGAYSSVGKGYRSGFGAAILHSQQFNNIEITGSASASYQPKFSAEHGYTWGFSAGAVYHFNSIYTGVGYTYSGYKSRFENGTVWQKRFGTPYLIAGYKVGYWDFWGQYYIKETQTANETEHARIAFEFSGAAPMILGARYTHTWFDQGGKRENDGTMTVLIGWRF
jgi:hypothetical protein